MDAAHEAELARILANRKKGNRLLGGGGSAPIPAPSQTPETTTQTQTQAIPNPHSPTAPTSATRQVSDTIGSGAIVIEAERNQQQQQPQQGSPRKYITTDVTSSTVVTRPSGGGNINNNNTSSPEVAELERIRRQGEDQARQIQQLQRSLDSLIHLQQSGGGGAGTTMTTMNSLGAQTQRGNSFLSSSNNNRDMINDNNHNQQQQQYFSSNQQQLQQRALPSSSPPRNQNTFNSNNNSNVENTFQKASAMGIFVKPHRVLGENGKGYITFQSPSRNTRGLSAGRSNNRSVRASSPGHHQSRSSPRSVAFGGGGGAAAEDFQGNYDAVDQQQQQNRTGLVHSPSSTQHRNTTATTSKPLRLSKRGGGGGDERIPKPFSTSTVDIDSAVVLLTTGDWFYKLRVQVQNASIVGPAGWKIESSDRRYVYLDTTTYILKWGDRPGGSATLFSHYVPINEIVSIQIYAQSEPNFSGSAPRTVYYIVMHVVEGGFNARGRAVNKRLCVIATELRDKADMWIDALQTIRSFYRSKGIAAQLHGNTYSSD